MKKLIFAALLFCICRSVSAQGPDFRHAISFNFNGGFPQRIHALAPQEPFRKWLPGLEYRYRLNQRVQLRAGINYQLPQTWFIGNPSTGFWSRTLVQSGEINLGGQLHFWATDYLENFQTYAFTEFSMGRSDQDRLTFNQVSTPQEQSEVSVYRYVGANLGLGLSYWWGQRWVVRFESAYRFNWYARELVSGADSLAPQMPPIMNGDIIRFFSSSLLPISELSIGWRF